VVWRESEQPFGEDWTSAAANDNQAGYTGHVEDAATGLTYMQARYYDPVIGRFLSIDPVGFSPGRPSMFNRYAYVGNDPFNATDPDGEDRVLPRVVVKVIKRAAENLLVQTARGIGKRTREEATKVGNTPIAKNLATCVKIDTELSFGGQVAGGLKAGPFSAGGRLDAASIRVDLGTSALQRNAARGNIPGNIATGKSNVISFRSTQGYSLNGTAFNFAGSLGQEREGGVGPDIHNRPEDALNNQAFESPDVDGSFGAGFEAALIFGIKSEISYEFPQADGGCD
jgi:RHS repeat-associated protein